MWFIYFAKTPNETLIEIGKTEKNLDIMHKFWFRLLLYYLYSLILYLYSLGLHNVSYKANFIFVKTACLKIGKWAVLPQFFKNLSNNIDVALRLVLGIDENIISINDDKNIKLFGQDLIDITLKAGQYVEEPKMHYLVLEVAISSPEGRFLFIVLVYPHPMISTSEIDLDKLFSLT